MKTKMIYEGKNDYNEYSAFVFVINGKGDFGNGEFWTDEEYEVAKSLANFIKRNTYSTEPIFEGDVVSFCTTDKHGITEWKKEIKEAYREWKKLQK